MNYVISQVLGLIGGILSILSMLLKKRNTFLYGSCVKGVLSCTQNYFLGEIRVIPVIVVEMIRNFVYTKTKKRWVAGIFIVIMLTLCCLNYTGVKLVLLLIGYTVGCITYMLQDVNKIKISSALLTIFWLPWNFYVGNYSKIVCNIIMVAVVVQQTRKSRECGETNSCGELKRIVVAEKICISYR